MKRAIKIALLILLLALCAGMLAGRGGAQSEAETPFVWIYYSGIATYCVGYDRDTGVMYSMSNGYYNNGTLTMLVNADGTPKVWEGYNANAIH
nr:MAG TPA: hypothetical protein [Caudoviricetes sp.]